ncbi:MAG: CHASE2 domain-containing protein [Muribaculaceae bacterium]|nr:CHASE2 domain-containing protein [Muribaculaceae bacterium]
MKRLKKETEIGLLKVTAITVLGFLLSLFLYQPFTISTTVLVPTGARGDYNVTDYYSSVADSRPVRTLDNSIIIVDIRDCSRNEIAEALEYISYFEPAAVGLDVVFEEPGDEDIDQYLLNVVNSYDKTLVLPVILAQNDTTGMFEVKEECFFMPEVENPTLGVVNLPSRFKNGTKREFPGYFPLENGDTLDSFVSGLARIADPLAYYHLCRRGNTKEFINYPSRSFRIIKGDLTSIIDNSEIIKNNIVLVGSVNDIDDIHPTPVDMKMSGILVHAYALSTILRHDYLNVPPRFISLALAFVMCFIVISVSVFMTSGFKGIILRFLQLILLIIVVIAGYLLFLKQNLIIDPSYAILILTFGLFAADIWAGGVVARKYLTKKLKKLRKTKSTHNQ